MDSVVCVCGGTAAVAVDSCDGNVGSSQPLLQIVETRGEKESRP